MNLAELLSDVAANNDLPAVGQIARIKEFYNDHTAQNPYKPGDLVTVRPDRNYKGVDRPGMVLEVFDTPVRRNGKPGSPQELALLTTRVIEWSHGCLSVFSYHHGDLEPYKGEGA